MRSPPVPPPPHKSRHKPRHKPQNRPRTFLNAAFPYAKCPICLRPLKDTPKFAKIDAFPPLYPYGVEGIRWRGTPGALWHIEAVHGTAAAMWNYRNTTYSLKSKCHKCH